MPAPLPAVPARRAAAVVGAEEFPRLHDPVADGPGTLTGVGRGLPHGDGELVATQLVVQAQGTHRGGLAFGGRGRCSRRSAIVSASAALRRRRSSTVIVLARMARTMASSATSERRS